MGHICFLVWTDAFNLWDKKLLSGKVQKQGWNVQYEFFLDILTLENEVIAFPQNAGIYLSINVSSCLKRLESLSPAKSANFMEQSHSWELQTLYSPLQCPFSMQVLRLGLPSGWTQRCLPQCWYMYTSLYGVTPEDCVISLTTIMSTSPQTSVKPAGSYHSLWPLLKLTESSPNLHSQSF